MDYYALLCTVSDYSDGTIDKNYGMGTFKWKVIHPTNFDEEIVQEITLTPAYYKNINNKSKKIETVNFNNYISVGNKSLSYLENNFNDISTNLFQDVNELKNFNKMEVSHYDHKDNLIFDAGYGSCDTYAEGKQNSYYCCTDEDKTTGRKASEVCKECIRKKEENYVFDAGYGGCETYTKGGPNYDFCNLDMDKYYNLASEKCDECLEIQMTKFDNS